MNELSQGHPSEWIAAYYDGELRGERLEQAQAHLAGCAQCRAALESLEALSVALQSAPGPAYRSSPQRFASEVMLRLPREVPQPWQRRALLAAWKLAPLGILAAWAFLQAVMLVAGISLWLFSEYLPGSASLDLLPVPGSLGGWTGALISAVEVLAVEMALTLLLAGLMWGWLASWWAVRKA